MSVGKGFRLSDPDLAELCQAHLDAIEPGRPREVDLAILPQHPGRREGHCRIRLADIRSKAPSWPWREGGSGGSRVQEDHRRQGGDFRLRRPGLESEFIAGRGDALVARIRLGSGWGRNANRATDRESNCGSSRSHSSQGAGAMGAIACSRSPGRGKVVPGWARASVTGRHRQVNTDQARTIRSVRPRYRGARLKMSSQEPSAGTDRNCVGRLFAGLGAQMEIFRVSPEMA